MSSILAVVGFQCLLSEETCLLEAIQASKVHYPRHSETQKQAMRKVIQVSEYQYIVTSPGKQGTK